MASYREEAVTNPSTILREFANFRGVDFTSAPTNVISSRSPYALNVYKDYTSGDGQAVETFPGYRKLAKFADDIWGIHPITRGGNPEKFHESSNTIRVSGASIDGSLYFTPDFKYMFAWKADGAATGIEFTQYTDGAYTLVGTKTLPTTACVCAASSSEYGATLATLYDNNGLYVYLAKLEGGQIVAEQELPVSDITGYTTDTLSIAITPDGYSVLFGVGAQLRYLDVSVLSISTLESNGILKSDKSIVNAGPEAFAVNTVSGITFYKWDGDAYNPDIIQPLTDVDLRALAFDSTGRYLAGYSDTESKIHVYDLQNNAYTLFSKSTEITNFGSGGELAWTRDAAYILFMFTSASGNVAIQEHGRVRDELSKLSSNIVDPEQGTGDFMQYGQNPDGYWYVVYAFTSTEGERSIKIAEQEQVEQVRFLVHTGDRLYWWNYPYFKGSKRLRSGMNTALSRVTPFDGDYYIHDGRTYLKYKWDENKVVAVRDDNPTIPLTYRDIPVEGGGGVAFQPLNVLTPWRKNTFICDGSKKTFQLVSSDPTVPLDDATVKAWHLDTELTEGTDFTVNRAKNKQTVTFATAPAAPAFPGEAELTIQFAQTMPVHTDGAIDKCTIAAVYDNRIFFAGNPDAPNQYYHTQANDASYVSASAYYTAGAASTGITGLEIIGSKLALYKRNDGSDATVFYLEEMDTGEDLHPKAYPASSTLAGVGCIAPFGHLNFRDDPVFLSPYGLEAVGKMDYNSERVIEHRSTTVDGKLVNESGLENAYMKEWRGYLCCLVNGHLYLADSRQAYTKKSSGKMEYEWYYLDTVCGWDGDGEPLPATVIASHGGRLYFGTPHGYIYQYNTDLRGDDDTALRSEAYNNDGRPIFSCWVLPYDDCGLPNRFKRTNRRGAKVDMKTHSHGVVKIRTKTERTPYKDTLQASTGIFTWGDTDFADYVFDTSDVTTAYFKPKEKKFERITCMVYSDVLNRPFGIHAIVYEVYASGYSKANGG